jgi:hypothetical protein
LTNNIVKQSNYDSERRCPVCKLIVKPSCKGHPGIPYSVYRMIEIKLGIKKRKASLDKRIKERVVKRKKNEDGWLVLCAKSKFIERMNSQELEDALPF